MNFENSIYLGQSLKAWILSLGLVLVFATGIYLLRRLAQVKLKSLEDSTPPTDIKARIVNALATFVSEIQPITILLVSAYFASSALEIPPRVQALFDRAIIIMFALQMGFWGSRLINVWLEHLEDRRANGVAERTGLISVLGFVSRVVLWTVLIVTALRNVGIDISGVLAVGGVGGAALIFAANNILADLFASLAIALDKPFLIGDAILVDNEVGIVEAIGLKTTRLRALGGNQLVYSNALLLQKPLHNFKRMTERRVVLRFGLAFSTSGEQLRRVPEMVQAIVQRQSPVRFDRVHLMAIGDYDFRFELVYFVGSAEYNVHADVQQEILREMIEAFRSSGIVLAQPTREINIFDWQAPSLSATSQRSLPLSEMTASPPS